MEAAVFFSLVYRLPAYKGVMRARVQAEQEGTAGARAPARYERSSDMANRAAVARTAPPATGAALAVLNAQLGGGYFSHKVVKADG